MSRIKIILLGLVFSIIWSWTSLAQVELEEEHPLDSTPASIPVMSEEETLQPEPLLSDLPTKAMAADKLELGDPTGADFVFLEKGAVSLGTSMESSETASVDCNVPNKARGTVVARQGSRNLVVFDEGDWKSMCKKAKGVHQLPMAWVESEKLQPANNWSLDEFGDRCAAYQFLETQNVVVEAQAEGQGIPCTGDCKKSPMLDAAKQFIDLTAYHAGNRCLIETDLNRKGPGCSFEAMLNHALKCKDKRGKEFPCPKAECEKRLSQDACKYSPWKDKALDERFQLIMKYAKDYATQYGIEPRAIPCIATVETSYLEPQAKTLLACGDTRKNRYHGIGMITQQTLEDYVSPARRFTTTVYENGKAVKKEIKAFRSRNPLLQRPSLYACPLELHDALGSSPELQVELMAYTLAQKKAAVKGDDYQSYVNYNNNGAIDSENGRAHKLNYADAVQACVRCLRTRLPEKIPKEEKRDKKGNVIALGDPAECLSIATRANENAKHHFFMQPGQRIYDVYDGYKKRYCNED